MIMVVFDNGVGVGTVLGEYCAFFVFVFFFKNLQIK
jgi:hypothetical protein